MLVARLILKMLAFPQRALDYFTYKYLAWAVALGALSAVSLPLGSIVGLRTSPRPIVISMLAAFGAGALVAALSVELVAPTVLAIGPHSSGMAHGNAITSFIALLIGAILGGLLFFFLDQLVNARGGFLRKTATSITYFRLLERNRRKKIVDKLSQVAILQHLEPAHINALVARLRPVSFNDREALAKEGDDIDRVFIILDGTVSVSRGGKLIREFSAGDVLGLAAMIARIPCPARGVAQGSVKAVSLARKDLGYLREISADFDRACREMTRDRLELLDEQLGHEIDSVRAWKEQARHALQTGAEVPDAGQLMQARREHEGAPLAIWLGILLDGIPESFVIGAGLLALLRAQATDAIGFAQVIPFTLIAGLFLSNFPEALSSSANMKRQGWGNKKTFVMWFSLMVITGAGAGAGFILSGALSHTWLVFTEGVAAGAMLTMIAAAMIPEAVHLGSANVVGLSTLAGFLAAISFKLLE